MIEQSLPSGQVVRRRAPRIVRTASIQLRRAGLRLRRMFARSPARDERHVAATAVGKSAHRPRAGRQKITEATETRTRLAALLLPARRAWRRFSHMPAPHRAWSFAAVTGTFGILLLLCWQLFGRHDVAGADPANSPDEIVVESNTLETGEAAPRDPIEETPPETITADATENLRAGSESDTATNPFEAPSLAENDPQPTGRPADSSNSTDIGPQSTSDPEPTPDAATTSTPLLTESSPSDSAAADPVAHAVESPKLDVETAHDTPATKSETDAAPEARALERGIEAAPADPPNTDPPKSDAPLETLSPKSSDDARPAVRELPDDSAADSKSPEESKPTEWSADEKSPAAETSADSPPGKSEDTPKPDASSDQPAPDSQRPMSDSPTEDPFPSRRPAETSPPLTTPTGENTAPVSDSEPADPPATAPAKPTQDEPQPPAKDDEPLFPEKPRSKPAPIEVQTGPKPRSSVTHSAVTNVEAPKLRFTIVLPAKVPQGRTCSVGFRVTNSGTAPTEGVRILFDLPPELSYRKGRALENAVGTLAPGETREALLTARAETQGAGVCRGILQTSGEQITDAEATISISQPEPARNPQPAPAPRFHRTPASCFPCPCEW